VNEIEGIPIELLIESSGFVKIVHLVYFILYCLLCKLYPFVFSHLLLTAGKLISFSNLCLIRGATDIYFKIHESQRLTH
jgi:hypothetical protein